MKPRDMSQNATLDNPALAMALQKAQVFADAAHSDGTRRVYAGAWRSFEAWCAVTRIDALTAAPSAVAAYLSTLARSGKSVAAINVALSAIIWHYRGLGQSLDRNHPDVAAVLRGIRRQTAKPIRQAPAMTLDDLDSVVASLEGGDLRALRDQALLLVGFFGALRRSEITALDITGRSAITIEDSGLRLHLTVTKTNLATTTIMLPRRLDRLCPVAAVEAYLRASGLVSGALFRPISKSGALLQRRLDPTSVRHILQSRLQHRGNSEHTTKHSVAKRLSPHSLRAGFITAAAKSGAPEYLIQRISRHKSVDVLRSYMRSADGFADNAANFIR